MIRTDGKNNAAFANEVFIINISSNVSPVVVRFDEANTQGIEIMQCVVQESVESPTGKKILLADTTESLELFCEDEMLFIWVQCSKWAGIMSVEEDGVKNTFDLYSEIPENRMIVYRRKVRLVE